MVIFHQWARLSKGVANFTMTSVFIVIVISIILICIAFNGKSEEQIKNTKSQLPSVKQPSIHYEYIRHDGEEGTYFTCELKGLYHRPSEAISRAHRLVYNEPLLLQAEPNNQNDPNAIMVKTQDDVHIGYIPKEYSVFLSKHMDAFCDCFVHQLAPKVLIRVFFKVKTGICYVQMVESEIKHNFYSSKYEGFDDNDISDAVFYNKWNWYLNENPEDFYIEYHYICALERTGRWEEALEYINNLMDKYGLHEWEELTKRKRKNARLVSDKAERARKARRTPEERNYENALAKSKLIFSDAERYYNDYSHLTPEQAERKLDYLKERDGWVEDYDYIPLKRIMAGQYPIMEIPLEVKEQGADGINQWFNDKKAGREQFSNTVFKEIAKILKAHHEEALLKEMETVDSVSIEEWVTSMKSQGFFFSTKAYSKARKIYMSAYPKPKPKADGSAQPKPKRIRKKASDSPEGATS